MSTEKKYFSIDIGAKNSLIAFSEDNKVEICINPGYMRTSPSVFLINEEKKRFFGALAESLKSTNSDSYISNIKSLAEDVVNSDKIEIRGMPFQKREIIAFAIRDLYSYIKIPNYNYLELIVPIWWNNKQKQKMIDAAKIAGFANICLINSTTAAAGDIYPRCRRMEDNAVIVDCGEDNFVISLYKIEKKKLTLKGYEKIDVGGKKITDLTLELVKEKLRNNECKDFDIKQIEIIEKTPSQYFNFEKAAIKVKEAMTVSNTGLFEFVGVTPNQDCRVIVNKEEFDSKISNEIKKIEECVEKFKENVLKENEITLLEIIGGCGRVKAIREVVEKTLDFESTQRLNAEEAFVEGAAYIGLLGIEIEDSMNPNEKVVPLSDDEIAKIREKMEKDLENENILGNVEELSQRLQKFYLDIGTMIRKNAFHLGTFDEESNNALSNLKEKCSDFYEESEKCQDAKLYKEMGDIWYSMIDSVKVIVNTIYDEANAKNYNEKIIQTMLGRNQRKLEECYNKMNLEDKREYVKEMCKAINQFKDSVLNFMRNHKCIDFPISCDVHSLLVKEQIPN